MKIREWFCGPQCEEHCWHLDERNNDMFQQRQCCKCPMRENRLRSPRIEKGHGAYFQHQRTNKDPWGPWKKTGYHLP